MPPGQHSKHRSAACRLDSGGRGKKAAAKCGSDGCAADRAGSTERWVWQLAAGNHSADLPPPGASPPKAGLCEVLFSPVYKTAVVKASHVGASSAVAALGGLCAHDAKTLEQLQVRSFFEGSQSNM